MSLDECDERAIRRHNQHPYLGRHPDADQRSLMRLPDPDEQLHTSRMTGCLTHITRFVIVHSNGRRSFEALCGNSPSRPVVVPVAAETFVCRACHVRAEAAGRDTFGLIPDGGCAVSGGKRGLRWIRRMETT